MSSMDLSELSDQPLREAHARARRACSFCARRKIRCTKELPQCSSCKQNKRQCSYEKALPESNGAATDINLPTASREPNALYDQEERNRVAIRYLDHTLFLHGPALVPFASKTSNHIPGYAKALVGDGPASQRIATRYYHLVHPWLPIVSKRKVYGHLLNPLLPPRVDAVFLLLCMKILAFPDDGNPRTREYRAAVQLLTDIQNDGIISAEMLQGCILLGAYEQGHALYPSAHVTIGICFKLAIALDMGWGPSAEGGLPNSTWINKEEETRTWWGVYLLERATCLGNPRQTLLIAEPELTAHLPCTEQDWNGEVSSRTPSTLSSPPESLGRYASIVQASYLLSRVLRHATDISTPIDFRRQEIEQLDNTLHALIRYSQSNEGTLYSIICYQTALSFCALFILYEPFLQEDQSDPLHQQAKVVSENAASVALKVAKKYLSSDITYPYLEHGDIPPFALPWLYKAGVWFIREGCAEELSVIELALQKLDTKWKAAGTYIQLLAARRVIHLL